MTIDRILAAVGIVIGLPAFLALFIGSGHKREGVLALLIVFLVITARLIFKRQEELPQFTTLELYKTLTVTAKDGSAATYTRVEKMRANYNGISEWWNRNNQLDGSISNILIDGVSPATVETSMGTVTDICKRFPTPLDRGEEVIISMSYDLRDSFKKPHESLVHNNSTTANSVVLRVELPRPCTKAVLRRTYNGDHGKKLDDPLVLSMNNCKIEATIRKPRMGASYHVEWDW